ncbi:MAG TPA: primosomal protein N', partial [Sphingomonas sp.]
AEAKEAAHRIGRSAPDVENMIVLGPAPAPLAMLRGRHRHRLLVHAVRSVDIQDAIRTWLAALDWPKTVRVHVDVDPYSFL